MSAAQQLLAKPDWTGVPGFANVRSDLAVTALAQQALNRQQNEAELAGAMIAQLGNSARQKTVTDAQLKQIDWTYSRKATNQTLASKLANLAPLLGGLGGGSGGTSRTAQARATGLAMLENIQPPTLGGSAQRMAAGNQALQGLIGTTSGYSAGAAGVIADGLRNLGAPVQAPTPAAYVAPAAVAQPWVQSPQPQAAPVVTGQSTAPTTVDINAWRRYTGQSA